MSEQKNIARGRYAGINMPELKNSFKTLLANIRFASIDNDIKSIAVVASGVNEGKTTVSLNLATAMGSTGKRTLIIEGDMRKRSLSRAFNVHAKHGIYSVLSGKCLPQDAVISSGLPNVYFLDSEPNIPAPPDLLSTNRFAQLVKYYRKIFDFVIVDTPPLISFVDGALIANRVDATIVVIREGKAKRNDVSTILKQLETAKANILGSVLTFSTNSAENEYYYAYYNKDNKRVKKRSSHFENEDYVSKAQKNANLSTWFNPLGTGEIKPVRQVAPDREAIKNTSKNQIIMSADETNQTTQEIKHAKNYSNFGKSSAAYSSPFEPIKNQNINGGN